MSDNNMPDDSGASSDQTRSGTINIPAGSAPGPDVLGQETVDVDIHPHDRPGVQSRIPDDDPRASNTATGDSMPVLLSSDISYDPIEGGTGSYTLLVEGECTRCGYDRLRYTHHIMGGIHTEVCNCCGAKRHGGRGEFTMPRTEADRAQSIQEHGEFLGNVDGGELYTAPSGGETFGYVVNTDRTSTTQIKYETARGVVREALRAELLSRSGVLQDIADAAPRDELSTAFDSMTTGQRLLWTFAALPRWLTVESRRHADDLLGGNPRAQNRRLTRYLFDNE